MKRKIKSNKCKHFLISSTNVTFSKTPIPAFADDYAFYIQALLDLYEVDFNEEHLRLADKLQSQMDELLYDTETRTGYYNSRAEDNTVFARMQEDQDGVEPCANSVAALNLLRLSDLIGCKDLRKQAGDIFNGHAEKLTKLPFSLPKMVLAANRFAASSLQVGIHRNYISHRFIHVSDCYCFSLSGRSQTNNRGDPEAISSR